MFIPWCRAKSQGDLPNSKIRAETRRDPSTSLHFDPDKFSGGMVHRWIIEVAP